jgi:hypothetical protein
LAELTSGAHVLTDDQESLRTVKGARMTTDPNPFAGRTLYTRRPAWQMTEYRSFPLPALHTAQTQWDLAEQARLDQIAAETARFAELMADESVEEPASKALENRLRVAFLGKTGGTMRGWLHHRATILATPPAEVEVSLAWLAANSVGSAQP